MLLPTINDGRRRYLRKHQRYAQTPIVCLPLFHGRGRGCTPLARSSANEKRAMLFAAAQSALYKHANKASGADYRRSGGALVAPSCNPLPLSVLRTPACKPASPIAPRRCRRNRGQLRPEWFVARKHTKSVAGQFVVVAHGCIVLPQRRAAMPFPYTLVPPGLDGSLAASCFLWINLESFHARPLTALAV